MKPHMYLVAIDPPLPLGASAEQTGRRRWKCQDCKVEGTYDELRGTGCAYVYPPCEHCGQTPECARDCPGIMAILGNPAVHVVGMKKPKLPEA